MSWLQQTWRRYARGLYRPMEETSRTQRLVARHLRVVFMVARWDVYDRLKLHAQALTYDTLLAIVPLLAVMMAVVKGFGGMPQVADRVQALVVDNLAGSPDVQAVVAGHIHEFMGNIQTGGMGAVSILLLILSLLSLLGHIEFAFNAIFATTSGRPLHIRLMTYWGILTLGPLLVAASFAVTGATAEVRAVQAVGELELVRPLLMEAVPLALTWAAFAAMYLWVPQVPVRPGAALPAAVFAGTLWHAAKYGYGIYARNAFTTQNIYGSLATVPLFILWLYVSWLLVLFGAQLSHALQHASIYGRDAHGRPAHHGARELAICRVFLAIAADFLHRRPPTER
ncbi:MAG TPA: YhjD/YihY/BrkB family envelope integrity protein, partial [Myxococcota bacterium]|nr:YhjD/YihY/BrkB family envelope integrity protein [Myxococcota bacterium]